MRRLYTDSYSYYIWPPCDTRVTNFIWAQGKAETREAESREHNISATEQIKENTHRGGVSWRWGFPLCSSASRKGIFIYAHRKNVVKKFYDQTLHFMCFYVKLPYNIGNIVSWAVKVAGIAAIEQLEEMDLKREWSIRGSRRWRPGESPGHEAIRQSCRIPSPGFVAGVNPIYLFEWLCLPLSCHKCHLLPPFAAQKLLKNPRNYAYASHKLWLQLVAPFLIGL